MKRLATILLFLAACSQQTGDNEGSNNLADSLPANGSAPSAAPLAPPAPGKPGGLPDDRTPVSERPIDPRSAQGAGQVLQRYFAFVESGDAAEANKLWSDGEARLDLSPYREVHANIGAPEQPEGAAGSVYVDIPVQLYGRRTDGREFNARGTMTLRRVNDVPGSTPQQREWHIYRSDFPPP